MDASGADAPPRCSLFRRGQINFLLPSGLAEGSAVVRVFRQGNCGGARLGEYRRGFRRGLFTANADGKGVPAAVGCEWPPAGAQRPASTYIAAARRGRLRAGSYRSGAATDQ